MKALLALCVLAGACGTVNNSGDEDAPTITAISPNRGGSLGGATITVTGANLNAGTPVVVVGGRLASDVTATSGSELSFTLPAGNEGEVVDVTIANDNGFTTSTAGFTYNFQPVILGVEPAVGRGTGGTAITITGRGFQDDDAGTPTITIGGGAATSVTVVDDRTITATTGAVAAGTPAFTAIDVAVENANGAATLPGSFKVSAQGLLVMDRSNPSKVFFVDPVTGSTAQVSTLNARVSACALNSATGVIFGKSRNPVGNAHSLVTIDPLAGTVTHVGDLLEGATNRAIGSMTFVGNNLVGMVSGCCNAPHRLANINPTTGAITLNGAVPVPGAQQGSGIAVQNANSVFFVQRIDQSLDTLTITTSARQTGLPFSGGTPSGQPTPSMVNIAGTLFILERNNPGGVIYRVDPATAVLVKLAEVSTNQLAGGMCQTPPSF